MNLRITNMMNKNSKKNNIIDENENKTSELYNKIE